MPLPAEDIPTHPREDVSPPDRPGRAASGDARGRPPEPGRLAGLAAALARAASTGEVVAAIVGEGLAAAGAASLSVAEVSDEGRELRWLGGVTSSGAGPLAGKTVAVESSTVGGEVVRSGDLVARGSQVGLPLVAGGRSVGVIELAYAGTSGPDDGRGDLPPLADLRAMADLCAHALARGLLLDRERAARGEAERLREEFSATFDQAPVGVAHTDRAHRWLRFNRKLCEITGYSAEELRGLDWRAITHPDDLPAQLELERRMLAGEIPGFTIEKRYLRRDGAVLWVRLSTATVQQGDQPLYSVAMVEDITDRRAAEAALARQANLLDQAYDAFIAWEVGGPIVFWNQGAERLYGYTQAEAVGRVSHELLRTTHPGGRDSVIAELEASGAVEVELSHVARDGRTVVVRSRHQLVEDGDRRIVLEANRDVTELKALERSHQDFTAAASHDLKNPLSAVRAESQVLLRRLHRGDEVDRDRLLGSLTRIARLTDAMSGLVDDLVDVAVLRSGRPIALERSSADLHALVERVADLQRPRHDGEIAVSLPAEPVVARVDERRLARVLDNLIGNAVKFSPAKGRIGVELRRAEHDGRPVAEIVVRDEGVGIPADELAVVFERFRRGSNVGGVAGTGIGLAGASQIVALHGGTIGVESAEGAGSAFTVTLPLGDG